MRAPILWGVTAWLVIEALMNVGMIGKPRAPKTPMEGVLAVVSIALWVAALHYLAMAP